LRTSKKRFIRIFLITLAFVGTLSLGLCAGFFASRYFTQTASEPNPLIYECIQRIEQGDALFDENELSTWRETLIKYQEAKEMIDEYALPLPDMEHRIRQLRKKMDDMLNQSVATAKKALDVRSEMALFQIQDALLLDPENEEAKALYEKYLQIFPREE